MQRFIIFFMIFALTLATDVSVYNSYYAYFRRYDTKPVFKSAVPWKFGFTSSVWLYMARIYYINQSPSVTTTNVTYESDLLTVKRNIPTFSNGKIVPVFFRQLSGPEAVINLNLYTSNGLCRSIRVAEGKVDPEKSEKEYKHTDICFKGIAKPCVFLVDLKDVICKDEDKNKQLVKRLITALSDPSIVTQKNLRTTTPLTDLENNNTTFVSNVSLSSHEIVNTTTNSSANNTETNDQNPPSLLIYVIPSLIGMCVIILVIYISVKKYYLQNSHPVETIELNTYATANEVVYADLSLMHGDSQPPRCDEESPYAEIIGVLHPH